MSNKKTKHKQYVNNNNTVESIGTGVVQSLANDFVKAGMSDWWKQVLGTGEFGSNGHQEGDLAEGQELNLSTHNKQPHAERRVSADVAPAIDYRREILDGEKRVVQKENYQIQSQVEQIVIELKRIAASSRELQITFKEVVAEQRVTKPGKYHVNFFEWVLSTIRTARMKIEDSGAWLSVMKSKKGQKQYWNMFKKHGTTFGLSNERVVATQTG